MVDRPEPQFRLGLRPQIRVEQCRPWSRSSHRWRHLHVGYLRFQKNKSPSITHLDKLDFRKKNNLLFSDKTEVAAKQEMKKCNGPKNPWRNFVCYIYVGDNDDSVINLVDQTCLFNTVYRIVKRKSVPEMLAVIHRLICASSSKLKWLFKSPFLSRIIWIRYNTISYVA